MTARSNTLSGPALVRHLIDVVSRGGNLLLNVGLTAAGEVPPLQRASLEFQRAWNTRNGHAVFGSRPLVGAPEVREALPVRWTTTDGFAHAFIDGRGEMIIPELPDRLDLRSVTDATGTPLPVHQESSGLIVPLPIDTDAPLLLSFRRG